MSLTSESLRSVAADVDPPMTMQEENLMLAVLERAIRDYYSPSVDEREAAKTWLWQTTKDDAVFSCKFICERFNIDQPSLLERLESHELNEESGYSCGWLGSRCNREAKHGQPNDDLE